MVVPLVAPGRLLGAISLLSRPLPGVCGRTTCTWRANSRAGTLASTAPGYLAHGSTATREGRSTRIVAHDLRIPCSMIPCGSPLLQRKGPDPNAVGKSAEAIRRRGNRMNHLVQDLLDVTRIEAGQLAVQQSRLSAARSSRRRRRPPCAGGSTLIELRPAIYGGGARLSAIARSTPPGVRQPHRRRHQVHAGRAGTASPSTGPRDAHVLFSVGDT